MLSVRATMLALGARGKAPVSRHGPRVQLGAGDQNQPDPQHHAATHLPGTAMTIPTMRNADTFEGSRRWVLGWSRPEGNILTSPAHELR